MLTSGAIASASVGSAPRLTIAASTAVLLVACCWGMPARASDDQVKAPVRLVQTMVPERNGGQASEDLIIVSVDAARPESLDDEIAREHALEITARLVMSAVGLRIVSYRMTDPRRLAEIIRRLRADGRVNSAQANVAYRSLEPAAPAARVTSVEPPANRPGPSARESRQKPAQPRTVRKPAEIDSPRQATAMHSPTSVKISRIVAADVLAGGL